MDLTGTKTVVLILLGALKLVCGLAPLFLKKIFKGKREKCFKTLTGKLARQLICHSDSTQ